MKIEGIERILLEHRFTKETCLPFSMSEFPQFIITSNVVETDEAGTGFLSTFLTLDLNFRNFKDWITFRTKSDDLQIFKDKTLGNLN